MDRATLYENELYNVAINCGVKAQPKAFVSGGNNAGAVHLSKSGVRTLAVSLPCRYIHSALSVADLNDLYNTKELVKTMLNKMASGELKE
jgi:endoglucanase